MRHKTMMKKFLPLVFFVLASCTSTLSDTWEETKLATKSFTRQSLAYLGLLDEESRIVATSHEIYQTAEEEFVPLRDQDLSTSYMDESYPQARDYPPQAKHGQIHTEQFSKPSTTLASIFTTVYFNTDEHVLSQKEYYQVINRIASYLKKNHHVYLNVEGHCDQRASEAYNLALGTRRAQFVRSLLIKAGVNADQVYTVSYGKERPAAKGNTKESLSRNRRVEFKIFQQRS
ncbi:MAG: OmpA family protein [Chlamydiia bacterium]